jgi:hypothetical protein
MVTDTDPVPPLVPETVSEAGPVHGWVVVVGGRVVDEVDVVVVGFFLFGTRAAPALEAGWADTATPVPRRMAPTTRAPRPNVPSRRTTNLERPT